MVPKNPELTLKTSNHFDKTPSSSSISSVMTRAIPSVEQEDYINLTSEFTRYEEEKFKLIMQMDGIKPSDVI